MAARVAAHARAGHRSRRHRRHVARRHAHPGGAPIAARVLVGAAGALAVVPLLGAAAAGAGPWRSSAEHIGEAEHTVSVLALSADTYFTQAQVGTRVVGASRNADREPIAAPAPVTIAAASRVDLETSVPVQVDPSPVPVPKPIAAAPTRAELLAQGASTAPAAVVQPAPAEAPAYDAGSTREIGQAVAAERGWTDAEWTALEQLWTRESNWNPAAHNASSGAHGIPQALPGSKMAGYGADWATNPETQIRWGLDYIAGRYGSPGAAWAHFQSHGWY